MHLLRPTLGPRLQSLTAASNAVTPEGEEGVTWDAGNKSSFVTLSGTNLVASTTNAAAYRGVVSTGSHSTGKHAFRLVLNGSTDVADMNEEVMGAFVTAAFDPDSGAALSQDPAGWFMADDGWSYHDASSGDFGLPQAEGEAMFGYYNAALGYLWFDNESNSTAADREAGTNPHYTLPANTPLFVAAIMYGISSASVSATLDPTYSSGTFAAWSD